MEQSKRRFLAALLPGALLAVPGIAAASAYKAGPWARNQIVTLLNNSWMIAANAARNGFVNILKVNTSNEILVGATINLETPVWDDVQFSISGGTQPAANFPTFEAFTTNTREYRFDTNDYLDLTTNELPHDWKEGTPGEFHLHIATLAANTTGENRFAKFTIYVAHANMNAGTFSETPLTQELTIPTGTATLTPFYLDMGNVAFTGYKIGSQVKVRVSRIPATGGTEYPGKIFITQCGCHIQKDTLGSRTEGAK